MNASRVYATDQGRICPACDKPVTDCECSGEKNALPGNGVVRIMRETKGRKGKGVTLVQGLNLDENELKALAKQLKQHCASGGSIVDGVIEIQGDHRQLVNTLLAQAGYNTRVTGG